VEIPDHDPFAAPDAADEAGGSAPAPARTVTLFGPLAERDPRARADETGEVPITGASSFDDLLVRARKRGFLAGVATGAIAAAVAAGVAAAVLASGTPRPTPEPAARPVAEPDPVPADPAPRSPAASAAARRPVPSPPPRGPAPDATAPAAAPGLDLRGPEHRAPAEAQGGDPAAERADVARADRAPEAEPAASPPRRLEDAEVAAALAARRDAIDACVAATDPDGTAAGGRRFLLVLSVRPSGRVTYARIDDAEVDATALGRCIASVARDMAFEPFEGEPVRVELPLRLAAPE
jgi:hypothetical protein